MRRLDCVREERGMTRQLGRIGYLLRRSSSCGHLELMWGDCRENTNKSVTTATTREPASRFFHHVKASISSYQLDEQSGRRGSQSTGGGVLYFCATVNVLPAY